jgi:hypothetical protein
MGHLLRSGFNCDTTVGVRGVRKLLERRARLQRRHAPAGCRRKSCRENRINDATSSFSGRVLQRAEPICGQTIAADRPGEHHAEW